MSLEFTPGQKLAIESRGSTLLVSAAAGSGKTRVLTERLLRYVADETAPENIDRFLVITYTRAAAAELRTRIMESLAELSAQHPNDSRLRRQQSLCCCAPIGTIHSFCTQILREYSHQLGLSPAFTVLEEERSEQLRQSLASRLLEQHYENLEGDRAFRLLVDTVGAGRDDRRLQDTLLKLYTRLRAHPDPEAWAQAQRSAFLAEEITDIGQTVWGQEMLFSARQQVDFWIAAMEQTIAEIHASDEKVRKGYGASFEASAAGLRDFSRALAEGWDRAGAFADVEFPKLTTPPKYPDPALLERFKAVREGCKKCCQTLKAEFSKPSDTLLAELKQVAPAMGALLDLTLELDRIFTAEKQRRGVLDFSDLEHLADRLLTDRETGAPTWVAVELSHRYREIMVDEYQDVNAVQERIFRAVSLGGKNLFLVGDVKQSIYRFRLADPGLFLEKYEHFLPAAKAEGDQARRIDLQENFRSRRPILDAANHVMAAVMSKTLGELDYDASAALRFGAVGYAPALDSPAEIHIISNEDEGAEAEARFIGKTILRMMREATPVTEKDKTRPCAWGDFVLLMRSPGGKGRIFHQVLAEMGIPVESAQGAGFYASLEVSAAVDLLSVIDNPHADIPLISVLRSPAFGFTPDELSAIRTADRDGDFFSALRRAAAQGNTRCSDFLAKLERWRALAPELPLEQLVWLLCSETGLFAICAAMEDGQSRRRNLMQLFEYARSFGENGYKGVFRFVQWLRRMTEKRREPEFRTSGQSVRIMTIHSSKGLEFPFVFLCDLSHRFNLEDARENVLLHTGLGLGPKLADPGRGIEYPTIAHRAVAHRLITESLSEEMRVLYVAMTRAREKLIMSWIWSNPEKKLAEYRLSPAFPVPPELLRSDSDFAAWIARAAVSAPDTLPVFLHSTEEAEAEVTEAAGAEASSAASADSTRLLRRNLQFVYPWRASVELPSKLTATELKDPLAVLDPEALCPDYIEPDFSFRRPEPGKKVEKLSAARKGTATHTFLQYVNFGQTDSLSALKAEALRMTEQGLLLPEEAEVIDYGALLHFFSSDPGQRLRNAEAPKREFRFLLLAQAEQYFPESVGSDDTLLLQGVVDCCFEENGGITVLDYKTDRISVAEVPERAVRYREQLRTYAAALERILGLPVKHCILWFLHPGAEYEVDLGKP